MVLEEFGFQPSRIRPRLDLCVVLMGKDDYDSTGKALKFEIKSVPSSHRRVTLAQVLVAWKSL